MLRALLLALVAANVLFFAFTRGWTDGMFGLNSAGDREPERLAAQVHPESVRILPASAIASAAPAPVAAASSCYEAGPFPASDTASVTAQLSASLPPGSWSDVRADASPENAHVYRVAAANAAQAAQLVLMKLGATARGFSPCATPAR